MQQVIDPCFLCGSAGVPYVNHPEKVHCSEQIGLCNANDFEGTVEQWNAHPQVTQTRFFNRHPSKECCGESWWMPFQSATLETMPPAQLAKNIGCTVEQAVLAIEENEKGRVYINNLYQVNVQKMEPKGKGLPKMLWLSIKRRDKEPIRDWRHMQRIKNELVGPEYEGVELYPAESRLVDGANQFHMWVIDDTTFRFPFGFQERAVHTAAHDGKFKQRGMEG